MSPLRALALAAATLAACAPDPATAAPETGPETPRAAAPSPSGASLDFERLSHDFGTISDAETVRVRFPFRNTGSEELVIHSMKASCGCTAAELERLEFPPGEGDAIEVEWKPKGFGVQSQTVKVVSNDAERGLVTLSIRAEVEPLFRLSSSQLNFGLVRMLERHTERVRVSSALTDAELVSADSPVPYVEATVRRGADAGEPSAHSVVDVTIRETAPKGRLFTTIKLRFAGSGLGSDEPGMHEMSLRVGATVYEVVRAEPNVFAIGLVPPGGNVDGRVRLEQDSGEPFGIAHIETNLRAPGVEAVARPFTENGRHGVDIVLEGSVGDYMGSLSGTVRVTTDIPEESPLSFLVMGKVGERKP